MAEAALPEKRRELQIKKQRKKCQKECTLLEIGAEKNRKCICLRNNTKLHFCLLDTIVQKHYIVHCSSG
jgi:hypothetical protein